MVLKVDRADHPECGVSASTVVDDFNPARDTRTCSVMGCPALPVVEFGFKRRPE